ncbi:hypothetical protein [Neolewinella agarilytica]|uniref:Uncharacterized protein n=1 Tax=Neolewinella agarilytica TaxID=478744 RepID=A0A1H9LY34_9BACT|nr:hypothetical protein [Neolewinella agarilytica]SER16362.1 hypothetical protein SAMN05444359_12634 [Neolewinella agarilytica]
MAKTTKYQRLQKAKASHCAGRTTKASLNKAKKAYIDDAVKKGNKTRTEATASANKVINRGCSAGIGTTKKKRKLTKRRKK